MDLVILLEQRCQARNSVVADTHNPCYLGGLGRRISVWGKQKLDNENVSQKNVFSEFFASMLYILFNTLAKPVLHSSNFNQILTI